ncbi:hypothetical protein [Halobellus salinisoli]|uniref:hypothetical protein n=1 Tax=Halobellus salinisoli TaxID=3108500 RepID=UPI0030091B45
MDDQDRVHSVSIEPGELVDDSNRRLVGRVSGLTDGGNEDQHLPKIASAGFVKYDTKNAVVDATDAIES